MLFFVFRVDKPGVTELRMKTRPAHLEWADTLGARVKYAGPTMTDDGKTMTGSVWVLEAKDRDDADAIMRGDPYEQVGLFARREIHAFMQVIPPV